MHRFVLKELKGSPLKPLKWLKQLTDAVDVQSETSFQILDEPPIDVDVAAFRDSLATATEHLTDETLKRLFPLSETIAVTLYTRAYVVGSDWLARSRDLKSQTAAAPVAADPQFVTALRQANPGQNRVEYGWTIESVEPGGDILARKGSRRRIAHPGEYEAGRDGAPAPVPGAEAGLRVSCESLTLLPNYYFVFGSTLNDPFETSETVRFYFNVDPALTVESLTPLVRTLNDYSIPFEWKCPNHPSGFNRADTAVLYTRKQYYRPTAEIVLEVTEPVRDRFGTATPLFTRQLVRGISIGEDPMTGESFGQKRCRLIAEGLVLAWSDRRNGRKQRVDAVVARFEHAGLDINRPWLGASGVDIYNVP
jgi:hypothetical protein